MLIRQNGPVFGSSNPYSQPGETQVNVSTRNLTSTDHYSGDVEQARLVRRLGHAGPAKMRDVCRALAIAAGCAD